MHHNGCACASCRPGVIEKEIAQLEKKRGEEVGEQSGPQIGYRRRVLCVISALFLCLQMGQIEIICELKHTKPNSCRSDPTRGLPDMSLSFTVSDDGMSHVSVLSSRRRLQCLNVRVQKSACGC